MTTSDLWPSLVASIAATARGLDEGATFVLFRDEGRVDDLGLPDLTKYVQLCRHGSFVRFEVVSNPFLADADRWSVFDMVELARLGWREPCDERGSGSPNWHLDVEVDWVELAAHGVVCVLRDLWGARRLGDVCTDQRDLRRFRWVEHPTRPAPLVEVRTNDTTS